MLLILQASQAEMVVDYKDWQIPLGRRFRCAFKQYMSKKISTFQKALGIHVSMTLQDLFYRWYNCISEL